MTGYFCYVICGMACIITSWQLLTSAGVSAACPTWPNAGIKVSLRQKNEANTHAVPSLWFADVPA